jgi:hypothetical protein
VIRTKIESLANRSLDSDARAFARRAPVGPNPELVEQVSHDALLAQNGVYAAMQKIQTPEGARITTAESVA